MPNQLLFAPQGERLSSSHAHAIQPIPFASAVWMICPGGTSVGAGPMLRPGPNSPTMNAIPCEAESAASCGRMFSDSADAALEYTCSEKTMFFCGSLLNTAVA